MGRPRAHFLESAPDMSRAPNLHLPRGLAAKLAALVEAGESSAGCGNEL
jgi:hypothetical protein